MKKKKSNYSFNADDLRALPRAEVARLLKELGPKKADQLKYDWEFWARPEQLEPEDKEWNIWIALAGRGFGKSRAGSEWVRQQVKAGKKRIAAVASTKGDVRRVMVEGDSGLLSVCHKDDKTTRGVHMGYPEWSPTNNTLTWANGAKVEFFSAEDPDRLRGPQFECCWCDELCAWNRMQETWDMLQFTLRLGTHPRTFITTTPQPSVLLESLVKRKDQDVRISTGSTYDNKANLAKSFITSIEARYEGTRLGRQELYAELLMQSAGALWTLDTLTACQIEPPEDLSYWEEKLVRVVVAIDPAMSDNTKSDETGIVVAGIDINGKGYVLEDATAKYSPQGWALKAIELYHKYKADRIVYETNQGGSLVKHTLTTEDPTLPLRGVHAKKSKMVRAEPISALYEQGKVYHVTGNLEKLERQMTQWVPTQSTGSPDALDACVYCLTDLMLNGVVKPTLRLAYSDAKGLVNGR